MSIEKKIDVTALGELLIDFTQNGLSEQGNNLFEANPGGAPCNVLAMLNKAGKKTAFIGKVGNDMFGRLLKSKTEGEGIDMSGLEMDDEIHTTLAFVEKLPNGDRDFSFYRNPGADVMLTADEVEKHRGLIESAKIFHLGTLSMTHDTVEKATLKALEIAKAAGCLISFDPNYRPPLWDTEAHAREAMAWGLSQCDILKIADNELLFLTGESDFDQGAAILQRRFPNIRLLNVTAGPDGSYSYCCGHRIYVPAFRLGGTIETTGAGDTFCACVLHDVLNNGLNDRSEESLEAMLRFANAAAYLVTTKKGAIRSMPSKQDIQTLFS